MNITAEHFENINRTPAMKLLVEGWFTLLQDGLSEPIVSIFHDDEAVVGYADGQPAGVISAFFVAWSKTTYIRIGYVRPVFRRQGVYTCMWKKLVEVAQERKMRALEGNTLVGNAAMLATSDSLGRQRFGTILHYELPV